MKSMRSCFQWQKTLSRCGQLFTYIYMFVYFWLCTHWPLLYYTTHWLYFMTNQYLTKLLVLWWSVDIKMEDSIFSSSEKSVYDHFVEPLALVYTREIIWLDWNFSLMYETIPGQTQHWDLIPRFGSLEAVMLPAAPLEQPIKWTSIVILI